MKYPKIALIKLCILIIRALLNNSGWILNFENGMIYLIIDKDKKEGYILFKNKDV